MVKDDCARSYRENTLWLELNTFAPEFHLKYQLYLKEIKKDGKKGNNDNSSLMEEKLRKVKR